MGLFNVDWNASHNRPRSRSPPVLPIRSTKAKNKPSLLERLFGTPSHVHKHQQAVKPRTHSRSMARPGFHRARRANPVLGAMSIASGTTGRRKTACPSCRRTHGGAAHALQALAPGSPSTGRSSHSTALGTKRRRTGLFDSMLGRQRYHTSAGGSITSLPSRQGNNRNPMTGEKRPWLHPNHQRAPTPNTGLGDRVVGAMTGDTAMRKKGEKRGIWARAVREHERGRRGRPLFT